MRGLSLWNFCFKKPRYRCAASRADKYTMKMYELLLAIRQRDGTKRRVVKTTINAETTQDAKDLARRMYVVDTEIINAREIRKR